MTLVKFGSYITKNDNLCFSLRLNAGGEDDWNLIQRPLIESVITFFSDRKMVNEGVNIDVYWDKDNIRWYRINFENIDDATMFECAFAEYF